MCFDFDYILECFEQKFIKTRKAHSCCECGNTIPKGTLTERCKGVGEGEWHTYYTCDRCLKVIKQIQTIEQTAGCLFPHDRPAFTQLMDQVWDYEDVFRKHFPERFDD